MEDREGEEEDDDDNDFDSEDEPDEKGAGKSFSQLNGMLCYVMLCYLMLCYVILYYIVRFICCIVNYEEQKGISLSDLDDDKPT